MDRPICPFEKTIVSTQFGCENAQRAQVGERIVVVCQSHLAQPNCAMMLELMQQKARFVFKLTDTSQDIPFGKKIKVLYGGLLGLQKIIYPELSRSLQVSNIHRLIIEAKENYKSLHDLPYESIVRSIAAYQSRRRSSTRPLQD